MTKVLGLTGGIATGKSTVSRFLHQQGAVVIDGDLVARQVVAPHQPGLARLVAAFGPTILAPDGTLKRAQLGQMVFGHPAAEAKLNGILGPLIHQEIVWQLTQARQAGVRLVILDVPLLYEGGYETLCDAVMVVQVSAATQFRRLMARNGYDETTAHQRINAQWPLAKKAARAQVVINNEGSVAQTHHQVMAWLFQWLLPVWYN